MKNYFRPLVFCLLASPLWNISPVQAQASQTTPRGQTTYEISLKNVSAHLMAWWLDPVHQPRPTELGPLPPGERAATPIPNSKEHPLFGLNANVDEIQADDAAKLVRVSGKNIDIEKMQATVKLLDQPLRYVEIETRLVHLTNDDLKLLNLDLLSPPVRLIVPGQFPPPTPRQLEPKATFIRVPSDATKLLATPSLSPNRYDMPAPRTVILSNGSKAVEFARSRSRTSKPQADGKADTHKVRATLNLHLTPILNNDDTVTILSNLNGRVERAPRDTTLPTNTTLPLNLHTIFNVKAGETIAMRIPSGDFPLEFLDIPHVAPVPTDDTMNPGVNLFRISNANLVLFIKARPVPLPVQ